MRFRFPNGRGIGCRSPDQFLLSPVESVDREVGGAGVVDQDRDGRIVALLPVGPIFFLCVKDFDAVVKAVPLTDMGVKEEIWGVVKREIVVGGKEVEEKGSALGWEIDEVKGDLWFHLAKNFLAQAVRSIKGRRKARCSAKAD